jgi:hypothetical protein
MRMIHRLCFLLLLGNFLYEKFDLEDGYLSFE